MDRVSAVSWFDALQEQRAMGNLAFVFFFFQAEDGIRDYKVTGVQTCALPITDRAKGYHGGTTAFIVPRETPGFRVSGTLEKMGLRTSPLGELVFEDVCVPAAAALGGVGGGARVFTHAMDWERVCLFASHLGTMEWLLEEGVTDARTRTQFGQPIGKFQAVAHRIADMKVRLEAARLLVRSE